MARYVTDPETGIRTKVSGTNYIPPCVVKNELSKAAKQAEKPAEPVVEPEPKTE
jgi:hypothetical protein